MRGLAVLFHLSNALEGLKGADQDTATSARDLAADVEHEVIAIAKIDVSMASPQKHRLITRGRPAKMMRGRIAGRIGFGFHNAPSHSGGRKLANDDLADQEPRQHNGPRWQVAAPQPSNEDGPGRVRADAVGFGAYTGRSAHAVHSSETACSGCVA